MSTFSLNSALIWVIPDGLQIWASRDESGLWMAGVSHCRIDQPITAWFCGTFPTQRKALAAASRLADRIQRERFGFHGGNRGMIFEN